MGFITRLIFHIISNAIGIFLAAKFIEGFNFSGTLVNLLIAALILSLINIFLRPLLKLLFGPFIILTLGLFLILINAFLLYILDLFITPLTIEGYLPLFWASLLIGAINYILGVGGKKLKNN